MRLGNIIQMKLIELTKVCTGCQKRKNINSFYKSKRGKFGTYAKCKRCEKIYDKTYYTDHARIIKKKAKKYRESHPTNKIKAKEKKAYDKIYRAAKKDKINICKRVYQNNRRKIDSMFRLNKNISSAISRALKENKKGRKWESLVEFTLEDLKKHLEKQFTKKMTWENYGEWHIEHKTPISAHNFKKPEHKDFLRCWALNNLQPMWAKENILKGAKIGKPFQQSLLI